MAVLKHKTTAETRFYPHQYQIEGMGLADPQDWAWVEDVLELAKLEAGRQVETFASDARRKVAAGADHYKTSGWAAKAAIAERIVAGTASDEDRATLQLEVDKRGKGETVEELAQKQVTKAHQLASAVAIIDGMESAALSLIETQETADALQAALEELLATAQGELTGLLSGSG